MLCCVSDPRRHRAHTEQSLSSPGTPACPSPRTPSPPSSLLRPWRPPQFSPARSPCCTSGRPLLRTSCAPSEEQNVGEVMRKGLPELWGACWGGHRSRTYHRHLFLEVIQIPAFLAFVFLGRTLVIFLVLRGGDTIAVRATRLRARRDSRGTPALRAPAHLLVWVPVSLAVRPSLGVSLCRSGPPCLCPGSLGSPRTSETCLIKLASLSLGFRDTVP